MTRRARTVLGIVVCLVGAAANALVFVSDHNPVTAVLAVVLAFGALAAWVWINRTTDRGGVRTWRP